MNRDLEKFTEYCDTNCLIEVEGECERHKHLVGLVYERPSIIGIDPEIRWRDVKLPFGSGKDYASDLIFRDDNGFVVVECKASARTGSGAHKQLRKAYEIITGAYEVSPRLIAVKLSGEENKFVVTDVHPYQKMQRRNPSRRERIPQILSF